MKSRLTAAVSVAIAAMVLLAACGTTAQASSKASAGSVLPLLNAGATQEYSTLDPYKSVGCNALYCALFMEHLLTIGANGKLEPLLASSWQETNPVTYVYHLRHGVRFWDGNEMTSADVVYSIENAMSPGSAPAIYFDAVKSVVAKDRYTVVITLNQPQATFKWQVAYEAPIFEKAYKLAHPNTFGNPGTLIQATGPWKVDSFDPTRSLELSANPHWWGGKVPIKHISFKLFSDEKSEALALRAGTIDIGFPNTDYDSFKSLSGAKLATFPYNYLFFFSMNTHLAPWSDVHVRRAVAYALNRTDIIDATGGSATAFPAYSDIPALDLDSLGSKSQVASVIDSLPQYRHNLDKAKQELAQSADPHGFSATIEVNSADTIDINATQVIAAELKKIGIDLTLKSVPSDQFFTDLDSHQQAVFFNSEYAVPPDPGQFASDLFSAASAKPGVYNNAANWTSAQTDQLIDQGLDTQSPSQRLGIYKQLLQKSATDEPYVPIFQENVFVATRPGFKLSSYSMWAGFLPWALDVKYTGGGQ